jgi:Patatin-like phospholipase
VHGSTAVVDIRAVALDLLWPVHSIADTYSDHFRQAFFGGATLADLPERPILLINVTDLEAGPEQAREVIFPGRSAATAVDGVSLDASTTVADAVAASGAFPGAFRPKYIRWLPADAGVAGTTTARERRFVDGGVVDNFGVEGLRRYLALPGHDGALPARPNLLIISDASGYTGPGSFTPDAVGLLSRSSAFTYEALHRQLYARYAGVLDLLDMVTRLPVREQVGMVTYRSIDERLGTGAPERLATVVLPVTSEAMRFVLARYPECRNDRGEDAWTVHGRVSVLRTLYELGPEEVKDAFWLGYVVGRVYRPAVECAHALAVGGSCAPVSRQAERQAEARMTCPPEATLLTGRPS